MSVRENLLLGGLVRGKPRRRQNMDRVFGIFPRLSERSKQLGGTLSGGEQQMLAIGRGMMSEPELLILDEPSLGLSPLLVDEMFGLVRQLNADGQSILLMEQNAVQALAVAHRAYIVESGLVTMQGAASELLRTPELRRRYLGL